MANEKQPSMPLIDGLDVDITRVVDEPTVISELLELDGREILELGCGRAVNTRAIAEDGEDRAILALEVDERQHALNLQIEDLENVSFAMGGAEEIPTADQRFDAVFLFKSLHHVPADLMPAAMREIARVLRLGGYAYVSEPLFRGSFNDCLRLFHDESQVRSQAFAAIESAVSEQLFVSVSQTFFLAPVHFASFEEFERLVIGTTHSNHVLSDEVYAQVRERFSAYASATGVQFEQPMRVDLLQRLI